MIDKQEFRQAVYDVVRLIPKGRVTSYGAIARAIGYPNHSRWVGKIMNGCVSENGLLPAHRVVNARGELVGRDFFSPFDPMKDKLESEGIEIRNNEIIHWKRVFWDPINELEI